MSGTSKQIGWSNESNLLYELTREVKRLQIITSNVTVVSSVTETPSITVLASSTTVAAGARSLTLITSSTFVGTILGVNATADSVYTFSAQAGNTLGAIAITMSAGSVTVLKTI